MSHIQRIVNAYVRGRQQARGIFDKEPEQLIAKSFPYSSISFFGTPSQLLDFTKNLAFVEGHSAIPEFSEEFGCAV